MGLPGLKSLIAVHLSPGNGALFRLWRAPPLALGVFPQHKDRDADDDR